MAEINIKLSKYDFAPEFIPLLRDINTTKILYGSRNSTKSDISCFLKLKRCLTLPYFKCLMVRKFQSDVRTSLFDTLKSVAQRVGIDHLFDFKDHSMQIVCKLNGNTFMAMGLYEHAGKTGNAKSILNPTDAIVEEADQCTETEVEEMIFSLRGSNDIEVILIFNTSVVDENHWIFKRWFPPRETFEKLDGSHTYVKSTRRGTTIMHSTYLMNPYVPSTILAMFQDQKEYSYERYQVTGLGLMMASKQSNMALKSFNRLTHVSDKVEFNKEVLVYLSWDFNRLPHHTVGLWQFGGSDAKTNDFYWDLVAEFCLPDLSVKEVTQKVIEYLKQKGYMTNRIVIICDYSGNTKKDHDTTDFVAQIKTKLKIAKFEVEDKTAVNPSVATSLDFLNDMFSGYIKVSKENEKRGGYTIKIRINPTCSYHIVDFEKTKTDTDGSLLKTTAIDTFLEDGIKVKRTYQARGHAVDGTRYMAVTIFKTEYKNRNKQI